jgi:hypothetical protein
MVGLNDTYVSNLSQLSQLIGIIGVLEADSSACNGLFVYLAGRPNSPQVPSAVQLDVGKPRSHVDRARPIFCRL